jgi:hypothetical protein
VRPSKLPRKRVPSSRRRNPGWPRRAVTFGRLRLLARRRSFARRSRGRRFRSLQRLRRRTRRRVRGCWRERNCGIRSTGRRRRIRGNRHRRLKRLVECGFRRSAARRREREQERQPEKQSPAPPARLGEKISRLSRAHEGARRTAHATKRRGHASALSRLHQHGDDEDEAIDDQKN